MKADKQFDTFAEAQDYARDLAKKRIKHSVKSIPPNFVVSYEEAGVAEKLDAHQPQSLTAKAITPKKEKIFLNSSGVLVTNARLSAEGQIFIMDDIVDVEVNRVDYKLVPLIFFLAGIYLIYTMGLVAIIFPASIFFILAAFSFNVDLSTPRIKVTKSNGNKVVVLSSNNEKWVSYVASAIGSAIKEKIVLDKNDA